MSDIHCRRGLKSTFAALAAVGALAANVGMRLPANPGDCAVQGDSWVSANGGCQDPSGRVWAASRYTQTVDPYRMATYSGAKTYCAYLVEGGQSDWRLPTTAEFKTAVSCGAAAHLNLPEQAPGWGRWLSETKGKMYGYFGIFQDGTVHQTLQTSQLDVMCVR